MANEHPQFSIETLDMSIADFIKSLYPTAKIFTNPTKTTYNEHCFYIQYITPIGLKNEVDMTALKDVFAEITYEYPYNDDELFDKYKAVAENIDNNIGNLKYNVYQKDAQGNYVVDTEGKPILLKAIPLYTFEKTMKWDTNAMHYQFHMRLRLIEGKATGGDKIQEVQLTLTVD